jgi:predicted small lipoprotein YifL
MRVARLASSLILVMVTILPGCGQKGSLYLPDSGGEVITRPTQTPAEPTPVPPASPPASSPAPKSPQDEPKPPR